MLAVCRELRNIWWATGIFTWDDLENNMLDHPIPLFPTEHQPGLGMERAGSPALAQDLQGLDPKKVGLENTSPN